MEADSPESEELRPANLDFWLDGEPRLVLYEADISGHTSSAMDKYVSHYRS